MKTVFDLDDQVPVRAVTFFRTSVECAREKMRNPKEVTAEKNISSSAVVK